MYRARESRYSASSMKSRGKMDETPRESREENDPRPCVSAERCHRKHQHVTGFSDPRWETGFVRWCAVCKRFVVSGRS
jgi:hypothetical protein